MLSHSPETKAHLIHSEAILADSIAVRLTKVIDAPTPIRPDTKLF